MNNRSPPPSYLHANRYSAQQNYQHQPNQYQNPHQFRVPSAFPQVPLHVSPFASNPSTSFGNPTAYSTYPTFPGHTAPEEQPYAGITGGVLEESGLTSTMSVLDQEPFHLLHHLAFPSSSSSEYPLNFSVPQVLQSLFAYCFLFSASKLMRQSVLPFRRGFFCHDQSIR